MTRLSFLALVGLWPRRPDFRRALVLASEADNCGASNEYADGYRDCAKALLRQWDTGKEPNG